MASIRQYLKTKLANARHFYFNRILRDDLEKDFKKVDILFICGDADRGMRKNGKLYSQILDPLVEMASFKKISYENITNAVSHVKKNRTFTKAKRVNQSYMARGGQNFWPWLFDQKILPKVIVGIDLSHNLNKAAFDRGIRTIEVMHGFGLATDDYVWGVEARKGRDYRYEPSAFIAYDLTSYDTLAAFTHNKNVKIHLARHHFFDRMEVDTKGEIRKSIEKLDQRARQKKGLILVTLQHGYEGTKDYFLNILDNHLIHDSLTNVIREDKEYLWLIKPHPVQLRGKNWGKYSKLLSVLFGSCPHVIINDYFDADIVAILNISCAHITMMSGATVEAAMIGVPTLGLCPTLQNGRLMCNAFKAEESMGLFQRAKLDESEIKTFLRTKANGNSDKNLEQLSRKSMQSAFDHILTYL